MNTKEISREQISALVDSELSEAQLESAWAGLYEDGRPAWDVYHQIGDALRSDDMSHVFSPDFSARMAARLEAEPAIVAIAKPASADRAVPPALQQEKSKTHFRRFAIPAAAAAIVAVAVMVNPHRFNPIQDGAGEDAMATAKVQLQPAANYSMVASSAPTSAANSETAKNDVILRDPRIDEYLLAHQRYSPSLYSTAQYARTAPFTSDADK